MPYYIIAIIILFISFASALKISPPTTINSTNFQAITQVTIDTFLQNGSANHQPWFLFFKIPNCKHCQQGQMLFNSFFVEYNKRLHFEGDAVPFQKNFRFGIIDCQQSVSVCSRFNINQYPTYYVVEGNGQICAYIGDRMPFSMITYLEQRKANKINPKCKVIGKITIFTKFYGYIQPLVQFANYNTAMFMIAFIIGPFLFGYIFSRNKVRKQGEVILDKKQNKSQ